MTVVPTTVVVFSVFQLFQDLEFDGARGGIAGVLLRLGLALGLFLLLSAITPKPHNPAARQPPSGAREVEDLSSAEFSHQAGPEHVADLTGVSENYKLTPVVKTQVYLGREELEALHQVADRSDRSVADLIREAIRRVWLRPTGQGPVALWDGPPQRASVDHDSIYDNP